MSENFTKLWIFFALILATGIAFKIALYFGQEDLPRRDCIDGKLYIHTSDGVYVKSNRECIK